MNHSNHIKLQLPNAFGNKKTAAALLEAKTAAVK